MAQSPKLNNFAFKQQCYFVMICWRKIIMIHVGVMCVSKSGSSVSQYQAPATCEVFARRPDTSLHPVSHMASSE